MIQEAVNILSSGRDLTGLQMTGVMQEIMSGKAETPAIVSFLSGLSNKGETVEELTAAVRVMRNYAAKIDVHKRPILDTCGTGGDAKGTFNISTIVAFVVSGCGITVAKHGNRSISSCCGSADVLEQLGININLSQEAIKKCLEDLGIAFLFAPNLHPAMKYAMPARKLIGKRTMFNLLGPLSNPAGAGHQLIGVYDKRWIETLAEVLRNLGIIHCLIVHGKDGLDEITTTTSTYVAETFKGQIKTYEIDPQDLGFKRVSLEDLKGATVSDNAKIFVDILNGKTGPCRDIVILNAAAALYAADKVASIKEGIPFAAQSIDSGEALKKLELLREFSQRKRG